MIVRVFYPKIGDKVTISPKMHFNLSTKLCILPINCFHNEFVNENTPLFYMTPQGKVGVFFNKKQSYSLTNNRLYL